MRRMAWWDMVEWVTSIQTSDSNGADESRREFSKREQLILTVVRGRLAVELFM